MEENSEIKQDDMNIQSEEEGTRHGASAEESGIQEESANPETPGAEDNPATPETPTTPATPETPATSDETKAALMSLCVSVLTGDCDPSMLRLYLDAVEAKRRIEQLESQVRKLREEMREQAQRSAEEAEAGARAAYAEGEIAGRNARIEESLRRPETLPNIGGAPVAAAAPGSIFDLAFGAR